MRIIPQPKTVQMQGGSVFLRPIQWRMADGVDARVRQAAHRIAASEDGGVPVTVQAGSSSSESYTLTIAQDGVTIRSEGAAGAFYALQTLKMLLDEGDGAVACCEIQDAPDMRFRGFYHDVTRGKVPTLATLKELDDRMASLKMNVLQLYIEHTFAFREYAFCHETLGYLTKSEIQELERYCEDRFIQLIPSVSLFGHLYHLLSHEKYCHLSELPDYVPTHHYWVERMRHHTINPELDESFALVKSLIDQYLEVTQCDTFNICCDETFDLGTGVNRGKDTGRLYVDFVKKIIGYLTAKGKRVMMWADIILQHPAYLGELPEDVIFLNWEYGEDPDERAFAKIRDCGRAQIVCPGTRSWCALNEEVRVEEINILKMAALGYQYGAIGMLTTNWGDYGNIASLSMAYYGLALGAAVSWNGATKADSAFRSAASMVLYGNGEMVDLAAKMGDTRDAANWWKLVEGQGAPVSEAVYAQRIATCREIREAIADLSFSNDTIKREAISAADGYALFAKWCARLDGLDVACSVDAPAWMEEYAALWRMRNKESELGEVLRMFQTQENG